MATLSSNTRRFMSTFNDGQFERMLSFFAVNGVYIDPNGVEHRGNDAIGASLAPIFDGSLGVVHYEVTSTILDEEQSRALVTWRMGMTSASGEKSEIDGLDILCFKDDKLILKNAFCKANELAIRSVD